LGESFFCHNVFLPFIFWFYAVVTVL
jgi:hypothetical protein